MKLHIGTNTRGTDFSLPLDLVTQSVAILAKRGVGKSYLSAVFVEELLDAGQVPVIIDPTGAHWGLKSSADGKSAGYPVVVFGGEHQDIPLEDSSGEAVARAIVEQRFPAIIDVSLFRKGQVRRFITPFLETLYRLNRLPLMLVVDEADDICPQKPFGDEAQMVGAMEDVVKRGRKKGIGCTLITQRPADLAKQVLTQCELLVAMRVVHPLDIKAIMEWVHVHADTERAAQMIASIPSLPIGTAWFWSPGWGDIFERVKVRSRRTFDSGATPKAGEKAIVPKQIAEIDIAKLGAEIQASVERAKADDPKALKLEISRLKKLSTQPVIAPKPERIEVPILTTDDRAALSTVLSVLQKVLNSPKPPVIAPATKTRLVQDHATNGRVRVQTNGSVGNSGMRRMMIALAQRPGIDKRQLGVRSGMSSGSGTFGTYMGTLRSNGWLVDSGGGYALTEEGVSTLGSYEPLPEGPELLDYWLKELGNSGAARILRALANAYPNSMTKEEVGEAAEISHASGTFGTYLGKLRSLELITGRGDLRASEELF